MSSRNGFVQECLLDLEKCLLKGMAEVLGPSTMVEGPNTDLYGLNSGYLYDQCRDKSAINNISVTIYGQLQKQNCFH